MPLNYRQTTVQSFGDILGELKTEFETIGMTINAFDNSNATIASQGLHITNPDNGASWVFDVSRSADFSYIERALCLGYNGASPFVRTSQPDNYQEGHNSFRFYDADAGTSHTLHVFSSAATNTVILYLEYPDGRTMAYIHTDLNNIPGDSGIYTITTGTRNYEAGTTSGTYLFDSYYSQMYAVFTGGNDGTLSTSYGRDNEGYYQGVNTSYISGYQHLNPLQIVDHALNCNLLSGGLKLLEPLPVRAGKRDLNCTLIGYLPDLYAANIKDTATGQTYTINGKKYIFIRIYSAPPEVVNYRQFHGLAIEIN